MCCACDKVERMPHVQIRNVPPELHRTLKIRAARAGLTLSEYLLREVEQSAETPTIAELTDRIRSRKLAKFETPTADLIREDRETR